MYERHCFKLHCIHIASGSKTLRRDFSLFYHWLVNLAQINSFSSSPVVTSKNLSPFRVFNLPSSFTISCRPRLKNASYVLLFLFLFFLLTSSTATFSLSSKFVSAVYTKIKRTFKQLAHDKEKEKSIYLITKTIRTRKPADGNRTREDKRQTNKQTNKQNSNIKEKKRKEEKKVPSLKLFF